MALPATGEAFDDVAAACDLCRLPRVPVYVLRENEIEGSYANRQKQERPQETWHDRKSLTSLGAELALAVAMTVVVFKERANMWVGPFNLCVTSVD